MEVRIVNNEFYHRSRGPFGAAKGWPAGQAFLQISPVEFVIFFEKKKIDHHRHSFSAPDAATPRKTFITVQRRAAEWGSY